MLWTDPFAPLLTQFTWQAGFLPVGDLAVSDTELVLALDLPGLTPEDLSIEVQGSELTVSGERKRPAAEEGATRSARSAASSTASRSPRASIPRASPLEKGVLSLITPKPDPLQPKRIAIGSKQEELGTTEEDRRLEPAAV